MNEPARSTVMNDAEMLLLTLLGKQSELIADLAENARLDNQAALGVAEATSRFVEVTTHKIEDHELRLRALESERR
jgi:hypothetical protein